MDSNASDLVQESIALAKKLGYMEGVTTVRQIVINAIKDYQDISSNQLLTANDAFQIVLRALLEDIKDYQEK